MRRKLRHCQLRSKFSTAFRKRLLKLRDFQCNQKLMKRNKKRLQTFKSRFRRWTFYWTILAPLSFQNFCLQASMPHRSYRRQSTNIVPRSAMAIFWLTLLTLTGLSMTTARWPKPKTTSNPCSQSSKRSPISWTKRREVWTKIASRSPPTTRWSRKHKLRRSRKMKNTSLTFTLSTCKRWQRLTKKANQVTPSEVVAHTRISPT